MSISPQVLSNTHVKVQLLGCVTATDLLSLQRADPQRYPVLLQSAAVSSANRHDVLMAFPQQRLTLHGNGQLRLPDMNQDAKGLSFLDALDQWWLQEQTASQRHSLPFSGGWFVYLAYELAAQIEPTLRPFFNAINNDPDAIVAQAVRVPVAIVRDALTHEAWFVAEHEFADRLTQVQLDIENISGFSASVSRKQAAVVSDLQEELPAIFLQAVTKTLEHIAAGDIYQANLSRGWWATLSSGVSAQDVYERLCTANPAPYAGIALLDDNEAIISSSPERLLSISHGEVSTRPIAGTRPRSIDHQRDVQLIDELRQHPKERAEHVMLLDLERNDLGRICASGSVHVDEYMTVESYAHVHHIVSNVRGVLRDTVMPGEALAAVFPGGTITGCPKVRCMQVIAEVEKTKRGAYTGSMGYLNRDGSMDMNILIRTLSLRNTALSFRAGAGIVADSIPERELEETRAKALGLLRALGVSC